VKSKPGSALSQAISSNKDHNTPEQKVAEGMHHGSSNSKAGVCLSVAGLDKWNSDQQVDVKTLMILDAQSCVKPIAVSDIKCDCARSGLRNPQTS
jgi:riboflavin synthase alpha subunit